MLIYSRLALAPRLDGGDGQMGYFDDPKNVREYIRMAKGFDGTELIAVLRDHLPEGSTILELGMGPGKDRDLLAAAYETTGSDLSEGFLDLYRKTHPEADLLTVDAVTIAVDRSFDCIYSNKVLHHLTGEELRLSFIRQKDVLNLGGFIMHSFWYGDKEEVHKGLRFVYYTEKNLEDRLCPGFEVVETRRYTEMEKNDSFYMLARKTGR